jgi:hypothetical protein
MTLYQDPYLQNVTAIANAGMGLANVFKDKEKRLHEEQYKSHLKGYQENEQYKPDSSVAGYDAKAALRAAVDFGTMQMGQEKLKQERFASIKNEIETKHASLITSIQEAESIAASNPTAAVARYMQFYSSHPNGISVQRGEDGQWVFTDEITGETWAQEVTLDAARQLGQAMSDKSKYAEVNLSDRSRLTAYNKVAMLNPDELEDKQGNTLSSVTLFDPNTGEKNFKAWDASGTVVDLTQEQVMQQGFQMKENRQKDRLAALGVEKEEQAIKESKATTGLKKEQINTEKKQQAYLDANTESKEIASLGPDAKAVETLKKYYGLSDTEAMDLFRDDAAFRARFTAYVDRMNKMGLEEGDPRDAAKLNQLKKEYGVEKLPGREGLGLKKPGVDPDKAQRVNDRVIAALERQFPSAPEGTVKYHGKQKYVRLNGAWTPE